MRIRPACFEDLPQIHSIYDEGRAFMRAHDNHAQWINGYPQQQLLEKDIAFEHLFVAENDGMLCGVFAFILGEDPTYRHIEDGAWPNQNPYGTIHRIAGNGKCKGLLHAAVQFALKRCTHLRCDTHADNYVMQNALLKEGFSYCGVIYVADGTPRKAYQLIDQKQLQAYHTRLADVFNHLGDHNTMVLSTMDQAHITSRMVNCILRDGRILFQTDRNSRKSIQLGWNGQAAFYADGVQLEGKCTAYLHPSHDDDFCARYKQHFPTAFTRYTTAPETRLFSFAPAFIKWQTETDGVPAVETFDLKYMAYLKESI